MKAWKKRFVCPFVGHDWRWVWNARQDVTVSHQCNRCGYYEHYWTHEAYKPMLRDTGQVLYKIPSRPSEE